MSALLLAEELFLLTHDDRSGKQRAALAPEAGLAGAVLLDLAAAGAVTAEGSTLHPRPGAALMHPLLAEAFDVIAASDRPRSARFWVGRLQQKLRPLGAKVGRSLVARGVLAERRRKVLGLFPSTAWPELDPGPERALRARISDVLVRGVEPDQHTALLVALLVPLRMVRGVVGPADAKATERRAKQIAAAAATDRAVAAAVKASVEATQAAIVAAVIVPAISAGS